MRYGLICAIITISIRSSQAATTVPPCRKCALTGVALIPATLPGLVKPTVRAAANTAAGCKRMYVQCTTSVPSMMEFNRAIAGPSEGTSISALLVCNANQKWQFTHAGVTTLMITVGYVLVSLCQQKQYVDVGKSTEQAQLFKPIDLSVGNNCDLM